MLQPPPTAPEPPLRATESRISPPIVLSQGNLFCVIDRRGNISPRGATDLGLFHEDTRHLSHLELVLTGGTMTVLSAETIGPSSQIDIGLSDLGSPGFFRDPQNFLHLRRRQLLDHNEFVERIIATNHHRAAIDLELQLLLDADFADIFELRGARRQRPGSPLPPETGDGHILFSYRGTDQLLYRTLVRTMPSPRTIVGTSPCYRLHLEPGESTVLEVIVLAERGPLDAASVASSWRPFDVRLTDLALRQKTFLDRTTHLTADNNRFEAMIDRALTDLDSLRLDVDGRHIIGAGIPWFAAPFGRDALLTSLSCLAFAPDLATETLHTLAAYQGKCDDPWREEEPGKIFHELRRGELARAGEVPHSPYYGTIDATPLWLVLLAETYRWTGDELLVDELEPAAERALAWIERRLERDGGLLRYHQTHTRGLENQGWKDSHDGVSHPDGAIAKPPIALIEVQGYTVAALEAMALLRRRRRDLRGSVRLREQAQLLRRRIDADFWVEQSRYYALALDGDGRRVATITSNPGHLAFCQALAPERVNRVAEVLLSDALFSGWGIRTVARGQAVYNPLSYHNGTIWPHDNALCALGLAVSGHGHSALALLEGIYAASLHFRDLRLPELFCGMARSEGDALVHYPVSCSPQAWATASLFLLLQAALGIRSNAEAGRLIVRNPNLPSFLRQLRLERMRVGRSLVSLQFERHDDRTHVDLIEIQGETHLKVMIEMG